MKINGQLLWTEYRQAQLLHSQPTGWVRIVMNAFLAFWILMFLLGLYFSITGRLPVALMLPAIGFVGFFLVYRYILLPKQLERTFFKNKELSAPFEMEITELGLDVSNEFGNSHRPWKNYVRWKENADLILLYHSDVMYSILPKRPLSDAGQIDIVKSYLQANQIPVADNRSQIGCAIAILIFFLLVLSIFIAELR